MSFEKSGKRLKFVRTGENIFFIFNRDNEQLGTIEYLRVGRFMQWAFCPISDIYLTAGCMVEIRDFMRNPNKNG